MHVYEMGVINMLNAEKYRAEILGKDFKFGLSNRICKCCYEECATCVFSLENNPNDGLSHACTIRKVKWLLSEYREPVKLTRLEYEILTYILKNTECRYITRNKSRSLCVHSYKPVKDMKYGHWTAVCDKVKSCEVFNNLFPFIKWEDTDPALIKDVLENCKVVEDDL